MSCSAISITPQQPQPGHQAIEAFVRVVPRRGGQLRVQRRGLGTLMPQLLLNHAQADTGLRRQLPGAVAQGMHPDLLVDSDILDDGLERLLYPAAIHEGRGPAPLLRAATGGEQQHRMAVACPVAAQRLQGQVSQRDNTVILKTAVTPSSQPPSAGNWMAPPLSRRA